MPSDFERSKNHPQAQVSEPTISAVIVTFNNESHVTPMLDGLRSQEGVRWSFHVQDNGSTDNTLQNLRDYQFDESPVDLSVDMANPGFAAAVNNLLSECQGDLVLVINPDTRSMTNSDLGTIRRLAQIAVRPDAGFVSPCLFTEDGVPDDACARREPTLLRAVATLIDRRVSSKRFSRLTYNYNLGQFDGPTEVDCINGAFMLVERRKLADIGPLDERFWMYGEDIDWCRSARAVGFSNVLDASEHWLHIKKGSELDGRGDKSASAFRSALHIYYAKHHPGPLHAIPRLAVKVASRFMPA